MTHAALRLDELVEQATAASRMVGAKQANARISAVRVVRALETALKTALNGDVLRGLSNIAGDSPGPSFQAARVRTDKGYGLDEFLPKDGREVLCLLKTGDLMMAKRAPVGGVVSRRVRDDELQAQDLEPFVRVVQSALERHITRAARTAADYDRVTALSARLAGAIGFRL